MSAPLIRARRVIAAKVETTAGTAESLTATEAAYNVYNLEASPTIEEQQRPGQGFGLSKIASTYGGLSGTATFSQDMVATLAQLSPFWNSCGLKLATSTFSPESRPPEGTSSGSETLTIGCYVDGLKKLVYGAMGNAVMHFPSGMPCYTEYTYTGCWGAPTDVALLAYTPPTAAPLRMVSSSFGVGSGPYYPKFSEAVLDLGNTVLLRQDGKQASGYHSAVITDRRITVTVDMEADLVANYDPNGDRLARTLRAVTWAITDGANTLTFTLPSAQVIDVQPGDRNGLEIFNVTYLATASDLSAAPGDDELTIVHS